MKINSQEFIELTEDNEIFVFGSNADGHHDAGAAKFALDNYGAVYGQGFDILERLVNIFIYFAVKCPSFKFIVTPIGCGIAGYTPEQVAPLFRDAPENVIFPKEFIKCLKSS